MMTQLKILHNSLEKDSFYGTKQNHGILCFKLWQTNPGFIILVLFALSFVNELVILSSEIKVSLNVMILSYHGYAKGVLHVIQSSFFVPTIIERNGLANFLLRLSLCLD